MLKKPKKENLLQNSKGQYRYLFNWKSGGFNDVWACNMNEFRSEIARQFPNSQLEVSYNTVHKCTPSESREWDKAGDMMCN